MFLTLWSDWPLMFQIYFLIFRYEGVLHNMVESVSFDKRITESPYCDQYIYIKRRRNVLSFSVGVIF